MTDVTNRFKKLKILGQGTFGTVYLCRDTKNNSECCVKTIIHNPSSLSLAVQHYDMINREIYILINLSHPRIIKLLTYFVDYNYVNLVMEYATNGTLYQLVERKRLSGIYFNETEVLHLLCDILLGINYMHIKHVIHRDLKLENILIGNDNRIKIADFGVAKIYSNCSAICDTHKPGTPLNMAPEVIEFNHYSFLTDIWSLGCIFYEICTFTHPFIDVTSIDELLLKTKYSTFKPINCQQLNYDNAFDKLIEMMLTGNPKKRQPIDVIINFSIIKDFLTKL